MDFDNFSPAIPTTLLGLVAVLFFYLYRLYIHKANNDLREIESLESDDKKIEVIEMRLNKLGIRVPIEGKKPLNANQKYDLLKSTIKTQSMKYLISGIVFLLFSLIIALFLTINFKPGPIPESSCLEKIQSLDSINHSIYIELKRNRIDTTKDTYQNLQIMKIQNTPNRSSYQSSIKTLRENNQAISECLFNTKKYLKTEIFKEKAELFIQHAALVDTRYESAMLSDSNSNLPEVTIPYPIGFSNALKEEIKAQNK